MALYGHIGEFHQDEESIHNYLDRLSFYLEANAVEDVAKQRAILLTVIGPQQFRLLKDLCSPAKPADKTFQELCELLKNHHAPAPPKFLCRAQFEARSKKPDETIAQYVAALRHLSEYCEFGANLDERLCEKFVTGINSVEIQRKLMIEKNLTLDSAVKIATSMQQSTQAANSLNPNPVYAMNVQRMNDQSRKCHRCHGPHSAAQCRFKNAVCHKCNKKGHIAKACMSRLGQSNGQRRQGNQNFVEVAQAEPCQNHSETPQQNQNHDDWTPPPHEETSFPEFNMFNLTNSKQAAPICIPLQINTKAVRFQLDTGAALTVMNKKDFSAIASENVQLSPCTKNLRTYTGDKVPVIGESIVDVQYNHQSAKLPIIVVEGHGPPLLGRNWLENIKLDWHTIFVLSEVPSQSSDYLRGMLSRHESAFGTNGLLKDKSVNITVKENSNAKYCKARAPPYAMRAKIETELERLEKLDIIKKVEYSDWATPIVPVLKKDGSVRICGDYKVTVNRVLDINRYPIPNIDDIAFELAKGERFTELDFSHAYTQLGLHPDSKRYTTINTHKGLYQYERLCFGISSSPGIFQAVMDSIFQDIPNVCVYFDNVYITGKNDTEHLQTLERVLEMVSKKGLKINKGKCQFLKDEIDFLGYRLSKQGIRPQFEKTKAIKEAPKPENTHELKAFIGMVNYYAKFCGFLTNALAPLYLLLQKDVKWHWGKEQNTAFEAAKEALSSDTLLTHYDPEKELNLTCDASPVGVAAILSHGERPIAYASRTLNKAEKNYSQIDREGLSLIFGIKKFHKFVFGRKFTLITDHKPLLGLFGENKPIPEHSSPRVQRWAITLAAYDYVLKHKPGIENNADGLSRLPLKCENLNYVPEEIDYLFAIIENTPVNVSDIQAETHKDECLIKVHDYCINGWPESTVPENLKPYKNRHTDLSLENGCILWGSRVIIPQSLQNRVLMTLHDAHTGMSKMKSLARSWFWWPNMDADIERYVKLCSTCAQHAKHPASSPLHNWDWPMEPWKRIHIDFAGPFLNKMFLIVIDAHSKWLDVKTMSTITANDTIVELKEIFANHGLPDQIVSDNGPSFTAYEFKMFCGANGIEHITTSPHHPAGNGLAEKAVGIFKSAMIKMGSKFPLREKINRFLTKYRTTPHVTTGVTPAELLCGRKLKTHIDLCHPTVQKSVAQHQQTQKINHDKTALEREFNIQDRVYVKNFGRGDKWLPGNIVKSTGPVSYKVETDSGLLIRRHADHIRVTCAEGNDENSTAVNISEPNQTIESYRTNEKFMGTQSDQQTPPTPPVETVYEPNNTPLRRSLRVSKAPDKLNL